MAVVQLYARIGNPAHGTDVPRAEVALVDDEDLALVEPFAPWRLHSYGYAVVRRQGATILMHRVVLPGFVSVDHENGVFLDNRRSNLRPATPAQQSANTPARTTATSAFKGVSWNTKRGLWVANIQAAGQQTYLGGFTSERDAADAYDRAAQQTFGPFARLNN